MRACVRVSACVFFAKEVPDLSSNLRLVVLDLSHNPAIGDLPDRALDGPGGSLRQVRLANIGLDQLDAAVFTATAEIRLLDASGNDFRSLPPAVSSSPFLLLLLLVAFSFSRGAGVSSSSQIDDHRSRLEAISHTAQRPGEWVVGGEVGRGPGASVGRAAGLGDGGWHRDEPNYMF